MNKKEQAKKLLDYFENIKDDKGRAVIDVNACRKEELFNPLSLGESFDLSDDVYDYIDTQANVIPAEVPLVVRFHGNFDEKEKADVKKIMQRHYTMKSFDITWDYAANIKKTVGLVIFGVLLLAAYFYISFATDNVMFAEILSIIGSFSLWEAADAFLLERPRLKRERKNLEQNLNQTIEFVE